LRYGGRQGDSSFSEEKEAKRLLLICVRGPIPAFRLGPRRPKKRTFLISSCLEADASTGRKHFFLKKEAKTFGHLAYASGQR
jgi:hypothetical protein